MRINTNVSALNTYSRLTAANDAKSSSLSKLSSGLRINKAGDDAAGLAISEKMKGQIGGLKQATRNAQDGVSLIQTAEGALNETHSILGRMRDLAVQGANGTLSSDDRGEINKEFSALKSEITRISDTTEFNTKSLLNSSSDDGTTFTFQIGANGGQTMDVNIKNMGADALGLTDDTSLTAKDSDLTGETTALTSATNGLTTAQATYDAITSPTDADKATLATAKKAVADAQSAYDTKADTLGRTASSDAIALIDAATKNVSAQRSDLGAAQNRLGHTVNNLSTTQENLSEANSRIRDVDMAEEMMNFTKSNILSQAATSMLAQANAMPNSVLTLLQ